MSATRLPIGHDAAGQPRTYRLQPHASREAAYRRLVVSILALDVKALTAELRQARRGQRRRVQQGVPLRPAA